MYEAIFKASLQQEAAMVAFVEAIAGMMFFDLWETKKFPYFNNSQSKHVGDSLDAEFFRTFKSSFVDPGHVIWTVCILEA